MEHGYARLIKATTLDGEDVGGSSAAGTTSDAGASISRREDRNWTRGLAGERVSVLVHSHTVGGRLSVLECIVEPTAFTPMHYHKEDKIIHILEGVLTFACGGKIISALPGTTIYVPAGAHHAWLNHAPAEVRMFVTFLPGGIEELFAQLQDAAPGDLGPLAAKFGTYIVGEGIGR